jgi:SAM-dependent methyltransferase
MGRAARLVAVEPDPALLTYEGIAGIYDAFNHANDYEMWLGRALLPELAKWGLPDHGDALDVACGTGRAFVPLLRRGWTVRGCDLSPAMLERAAETEGGDQVTLSVADMRSLPEFGSFDLVLSLNDSVNYLLGDEDLVDALRGMRANLAPNGLLLFDVNSQLIFDEGYAGTEEVEHEGKRWRWVGLGEVSPSVYEARIEGDEIETVTSTERFRPEPEVREAMSAAGLTCLAALGMEEVEGEVVLSEPPDEKRHYKMVFIGRIAG